MKIAVIDDYQDAFRHVAAFPRLAGHETMLFHDTPRDEDEAVARLAEAEALVLTMQRTAIPESLIARLPRLKMISQTGRNTGHIDLAACAKHGITVCAGGGGGPNATAEIAFGLILSSRRNIPAEVAALKAGKWQISVGDGLLGRTLGIYAFGRIGSIVARVGAAFGMKVLCWGREGSLARAQEAGFGVAGSRQEFFAAADVVSLHIPLSPATRGIVTADDLTLMKPGSLIVNTSRGPIIAEGALVAALGKGRPGFAGVDVYDREPVAGGSDPLIGLANTVCTPHLGYVERETYEAIFATAIDQILAYADGKPINRI